jgi:LmbE family N-acetylglucosaminyl deacetylase
MVKRVLIAIACCLNALVTARAQVAPALPETDDRYKADILLVVAHPDDESGDVGGYLARAVQDAHRRVAVVYATRGDGGSSAVSNEKGDALGAEREIEGRRALASLGVMNVWFLNAPDTASQDVLRSLEHWDHGSILGQVVRLIRLTRAEVILTWLPACVAGENHSDHQAASIVANEAFDLAGDPAAFGEQLATDLTPGKSGEGLHPWQPKKIYYFSDALEYPVYELKQPPLSSPFRAPFLEGAGPVYSNTDASPSQQVPYAVLAAREASFYVTQNGSTIEEAIAKQDFANFEPPARFILGKSLVGGTRTGDLFQGITPGAIPFVRATSSAATPRRSAFELGGPWRYYQEFWQSHGLEHLRTLLPVPEVAIPPQVNTLRVPLLIRNDAREAQEVAIESVLPEGWTDRTAHLSYRLRPGEEYPFQAVLEVTDPATPRWQEIRWKTSIAGKTGGSVTLRVYVAAEGAMQQ